MFSEDKTDIGLELVIAEKIFLAAFPLHDVSLYYVIFMFILYYIISIIMRFKYISKVIPNVVPPGWLSFGSTYYFTRTYCHDWIENIAGKFSD